MDGEVNNRTARIAQGVKQDTGDRRRRQTDETDTGDRQTDETDVGDRQTKNTTRLKELVEIKEGKG